MRAHACSLRAEYVLPGKFDPLLVLSHRITLEALPSLYANTTSKKSVDEWDGRPLIKVFVETRFSPEAAEGTPPLSQL